VYVSKNINKVPRSIQAIVEPLIESMYNLTESIATSKKAVEKIFPFVMTFFLFIFIANFTSLLPGFGSIGFFHKAEVKTEHTKNSSKASSSKEEAKPELVPLLRGATSDINVTLALAFISVIATHMLSIQVTGFSDYISRYLSFNPINLYVGILELVAEFTKIISLSFRLFGNIFAGEIALHTISNLVAFVAPLPFLLLESIVSVVQALVFSILTLVFMSVLTTPHHSSGHEEVSIKK
ncbi:MAG TPA: F0F1 ATP synthase subunit A, partial [Candidatus Saccharimonadales bacterium]|nr:F0F1 ATP synthase subunit A [Candidatus Saccharimonadales bacterium]